ncbi:dipeptidyl peptidase [Nesidiocoris tenuis]|uniref:Dipeptidyl peptidase n=1 Tax=Nesidiocoris tenuis TaxID=355587 RepID=A0ABN7AD15_9HEMI|nr:dipeptidyl peptidase [Nesidiocoris tenuis]
MELLSKGSKKKTTLIVFLLVLAASVIVAVMYMLKPDAPLRASAPLLSSKKPLSLESVVRGEFSASHFNGSWISDSEFLYKTKSGDLVMFDAISNTTKVLLTTDFQLLALAFHFELSADKRYLLLLHNYQKLYRHSYLAAYHIVDLETKKDWPLTDPNGVQIPLQSVVWAPVGNGFAYVYMNDIYYKSSPKGQEIRLTSTGRPGTIYNGVPDWVYEEEILGTNKALWFSPDGRHMAYATFNDSQTPVMNIPYYGVPGDLRYQYTQAVNIRYPKPGRPNPTVTLTVVDLSDVTSSSFAKPPQLNIPPRSDLSEPVLNSVFWANSTTLIAAWTNRVQNEGSIMSCSTNTVECAEVQGLSEKAGWIIFSEFLFSADGHHMVLIQPFDQGSDSGKWRHVAVLDLLQQKPTLRPLTKGKFVVTELLSMDEKFVYYLANAEGHPERLNIFRVEWDSDKETEPDCISCKNNKTSMGECTYIGGVSSMKSSYIAQLCGGPVVPEVTIIKKNGEKVRTWEENGRLKRKLENIIMPVPKYMKVSVAPGMTATVRIFHPPDLDTSGETKYPLLVNVYGGPDSNQVLDRFQVDWYTHLVVNRSMIYAQIDGRGSGLRSDKIKFANYRNLGTYEIYDQINVTKYLLNNLPYLDPERTAIWGWSYGGYASAMALALDQDDVFKCGISVAPVTDWTLYDTLYTERFMGLPSTDDNLRGYVKAALNNKIDSFRRKKYFLVHGTLDDNVHFQQSMMLAKALERRDILFEQQTYPDENHSLSDVKPHLYHTLENFLIRRCYKKQDDV